MGDTVLRVPPDRLKPAIVGTATAAGLLIAILVWHWAAAQSRRSATNPESATEQKSASATTGSVGGTSPDSDLTDLDLRHPDLKRLHR